MSGEFRRAHYTPSRSGQPARSTTRNYQTGVMMRLTTGSPAPDFAAESIGGRRVSLEQLRGRPLLLKFYRFATCPVCNLHMHQFILDHAKVEEAGLTTI